jgi:hypothetical protein
MYNVCTRKKNISRLVVYLSVRQGAYLRGEHFKGFTRLEKFKHSSLLLRLIGHVT